MLHHGNISLSFIYNKILYYLNIGLDTEDHEIGRVYSYRNYCLSRFIVLLFHCIEIYLQL